MIVPTSSTRSVRIAPNAACRDACFSDSGGLASPEPFGAAVYRIQDHLMRHRPTRERRRRALASLSRATADCHHSRRPAVNVGERESDMFEWFDAIG